jgi:outer membrane protein
MNLSLRHYSSTFLVGLVLAVLPTCTAAGETDEIGLALSEAVETALLNNLGLYLKQQDVLEAEGAVQMAAGSFAPLLSAEVGAAGQKTTAVSLSTAEEEQTTSWQVGVRKRLTPGTEFELSLTNNTLDTDADLLLFDPVYRTGITLGVTQPLLKDRGSEVQLADSKSAQNLLTAQTFMVDDEAADLAARVKNAYWELVLAYQNLDVLNLSLKLAQTLRDETITRIEAGTLASIDIFQPESEVAVREQELISGQQAIGIAEDRLKLLINSSDWLTSLRPTDLPGSKPIAYEPAQILEKALADRPDLKAAALRVQASQWQVNKAENALLPALDLYGSAGIGGTADSYSRAIDNSFDDSDRHWQVGLRFSYPLDNTLAEGHFRQIAAQHAKNRTNLELLKQEVRRLVRSTMRDIELSLKTIDAAKKTTLARQKSLEAEQAKFAAGRATTFDVLVAQQDFSRALSAEHQATITYAQARAHLDRLLGLITIDH